MLEIAPEFNVTYSVFRLLISFLEAPLYGLVYYMRAICTTRQGYCATSIQFKTYNVMVGSQYMSYYCGLVYHIDTVLMITQGFV